MNTRVIRIIVVSIALFLISPIFSTIISDENHIEQPEAIEVENVSISDFDDDIIDNPAEVEETRGSRGGELEWIWEKGKEGAVSTPALVDLDSDGFLEVVFATTGDEIVALNHDGSTRWINSNYEINPASYYGFLVSSYYSLTDQFSSITPANIDRDIRPELILSTYNGIVFLEHDGEPKYTQSHSGRYYFSTPIVTDLEGDYSNLDMEGNMLSHYKDLEIIVGSVDMETNVYLEAWHATGGNVFDYLVKSPSSTPYLLGITAGELSGTMEDDEYNEADKDSAWMELVFPTYDSYLRKFKHTTHNYSSAHGHNHPRYAEHYSTTPYALLSFTTPSIGNFSKASYSGNPDSHEIIVGKGGWERNGNPYNTTSGLFCYDMELNERWKTLDETIIVSSPAVGDVQTLDRNKTTKHLADYEIFAANSHEGEIFSVDADNGKVLWQWEIDGAKSKSNRILSSPALCNINADSELEVVVGSDNGKVYCFDGDPSDGINDGEIYSQYPGEGTTQFDLLWEFDTHEHGGSGQIGISSPVVADIDKDRVLEVIIGDNTGKVWCINAGGTSATGQQDWTMFHYDVNNSGHYDPNVGYSVHIAPARDPDTGVVDPREKFIRPGQMVTYNLSIINDGTSYNLDDYDYIYISTYIASNIAQNPGFNYTLGGNAIQEKNGMKCVKLRMQESTLVQLNVTAPWTGDLGDFVTIVIRVNSSKKTDAVASVVTISHLKITIDFKCQIQWLPESDPQSTYYNKKFDKLLPGEEKVYNIAVLNEGDVNDSYRINITDFPKGWRVRFLNSTNHHSLTVSLDSSIFAGAENYTLIQLAVRAPETGTSDEVNYITIEGVSLKSEADPLMGVLVKWDTILIGVIGVPEFQIYCHVNQKYFEPGEKATYRVYIENTGNVDLKIDLSHSELSTGWKIKMPNSRGVGTEWTEMIYVQLTAPPDFGMLKGGTIENVTITGTYEDESGELISKTNIIGIIKTVYQINASVSPEVNETIARGVVSHTIAITNEGNVNDNITISVISITPGWTIYFKNETDLLVCWKETSNVEFVLEVPEYAEPGMYHTTLIVSADNSLETITLEITTIVKYYNLRLGIYDKKNDVDLKTTTEYATSGSSTIYLLRLTNDGTADDIAHLSLFLNKYKIRLSDGNYTEVSLTKSESDEMLQKSLDNGGIRWHVRSIQGVPSARPQADVYRDFREVIYVDPVADIGYLPGNASKYSTDLFIYLQPSQSVWINIQIDYPEGVMIDPLYFNVEVQSKGDDVDLDNNKVEFKLDILFPDMTFDGSFGLSGFEFIHTTINSKQHLQIKAEVRNFGDVEAGNITVALYIDDQFIGNVKVLTLEVSSTDDYRDEFVSFLWKSTNGKHKIELSIDPDNDIIELDERNNKISLEVDVKPLSSEEDSELLSKGASVMLNFLILVLVLVIIWMYLKRRDRREQVAEEDKTEFELLKRDEEEGLKSETQPGSTETGLSDIKVHVIKSLGSEEVKKPPEQKKPDPPTKVPEIKPITPVTVEQPEEQSKPDPPTKVHEIKPIRLSKVEKPSEQLKPDEIIKANNN